MKGKVRMFKFKKLKTRLLVLIGTLVFVSFSATIGFVLSQFDETAKTKSFNEAREKANHYSMYVRAEIELAMDATRTLAQTLEAIKSSGNTDRDTVNTIMEQILKENPGFLSVWTMWEPNAFDGRDSEFANFNGLYNENGNLATYWYRDEGAAEGDYFYVEEYEEDYYQIPKDIKGEAIIEPYLDIVVDDGSNNKVLMTSTLVPIMHEGKFMGVVGIDIALDSLQKKSNDITIYETGYVSIISNNGAYVAHKEDDLIGKDIDGSQYSSEVKEAIKTGEPYENIIRPDSVNTDIFKVFTPINIGNTKTPWSIEVSIPVKELLKDVNRVRNYSIAFGLTSLAVILSVLLLITNNTVKPINKTIDMLKDIAEGEGDLTKKLDVHTDDEIGELAKYFNLFVGKIQELVVQVKHNADSLAEASSQISIVMEQANKGMSEIANDISDVSNSVQGSASVIEETSAGIDGMSSNSEVISSESEDAFEDSKDILDAANIGAQNIMGVVNANDTVKESTEKVYESIRDLKVSSEHIGEVISIINGISEQTNMLALNASIEAARAGEHGSGFAVVADEVRKLAEESRKSTSKISALITEMQEKADAADLTIKEGQELVKISAEKSSYTNEQFKNILKFIKKITQKIEMISTSSKQQSQISEEMTKAMGEISMSTQGNAGLVENINAIIEEEVSSFEEIGANVEELNNMAFALKEKTDKFKVE